MPRHPKIRFLLAWSAALCAVSPALPQTALAPGVSQAIELRTGRPYTATISADKDQVVWFEIDPKDITFNVAVDGPDGAPLLRVQDFNSIFGPQTFGFIAKAGGIHKLTLTPVEDAAGPCNLLLREQHAPADTDTARLAVQNNVLEGIRLFKQLTAASIMSGFGLLERAQKQSRELGDANLEAQTIYYWTANMSLAIGGLKAAQDNLDQAANLWRKAGNPRAAAQAVNQQAVMALAKNQTDSAVELFQRALRTRRELNDRRGEAETEEGFCGAAISQSDPVAALPHCQAALTIRQTLGDRTGQAMILNYLSLTYDAAGDNRLAAETGEKAIALLRTTSNAQLERLFLLNLGREYKNLGDSQKALNCTARALESAKKSGDPLTEASALSNLGSIYEDLNEHDRALEYLNQALPLKRIMRDDKAQAATLLNIGFVLLAKREYRQAVEQLQAALTLYRKSASREGEANALNDLGDAYGGLGEMDTALDYYQKALAIRQDTGDRRGEGYSLNGFGGTYLELKRYAEALDYYQRALDRFRAAGDRNGELGALYGMARAQAGAGQREPADATIASALNLLETARAQIVVPEMRTSYFALRHDYYEFAVDNLMRLHAQRPDAGYALRALETHERAQARGLIDLLAESGVDIRKGIPADLQRRERSAREHLKAILERRLQGLTSKDSKILAELDRQVQENTRVYEQVEAEIRAQSPEYAALTQPPPLSAADIQHEVGDSRTALLEYALGAGRSYLWVVTSTAVESFDLPSRNEIEPAARQFYTLISRRPGAAAETNDARRLSARLGQMLLGPARAAIQGKRLVIVPDGVLCYIPFAALADPSAEGQDVPMVASRRLSSLPAASVLPVLRRQAQRDAHATKLLALFGDPVFDRDDPRVKSGLAATSPAAMRDAESGASPERAPTGIALGRLAFSRREADEIHALFPAIQSVERLDFAANLEAVESPEMRQYRIIHFATHGIFDSEHPERSALVLSLVNEHGQPQLGFLKTPDIFSLDLRAELVVLSACQSALGREIRGEGLVGLTRAFFYAGARRVVASLWKVDDLATAELMKAFYRRLAAGETATAALQAAKIEISKRPAWASPYYWAAFELQGEFEGSPLGESAPAH